MLKKEDVEWICSVQLVHLCKHSQVQVTGYLHSHSPRDWTLVPCNDPSWTTSASPNPSVKPQTLSTLTQTSSYPWSNENSLLGWGAQKTPRRETNQERLKTACLLLRGIFLLSGQPLPLWEKGKKNFLIDQKTEHHHGVWWILLKAVQHSIC